MGRRAGSPAARRVGRKHYTVSGFQPAVGPRPDARDLPPALPPGVELEATPLLVPERPDSDGRPRFAFQRAHPEEVPGTPLARTSVTLLCAESARACAGWAPAMAFMLESSTVPRQHAAPPRRRHLRAVPGALLPPASHQAPDGTALKATVGLASSLLALLSDPAERPTHLAVAFDNPIRSFRNELFDGYKTEEGVPEELLAQFDVAEQATRALGIAVWSMREFEADDALATGAARWHAEVEQVRILTPDKDLGQCLRGSQVVQVDRMRGKVVDEPALRALRGHRPGEHPRLARAGGRHGRRHPRAAGLRREGRRGGARGVRAPRAGPRRSASLAGVGALAATRSRGRSRSTGRRRSCTARWRRSAPTRRWTRPCRRSSTEASPASRSSSSPARWMPPGSSPA